MKTFRCVYAIPGDTMYLREQTAAAKSTAQRLGVELEVVSADMDAVGQGQQLLKFVQAEASLRPDGIILEPVSAQGLPRVAEAAVAAGIGWAVSNALVDYIPTLRKKAKAPIFLVSQDHIDIGRIQGRQIAALLPQGGSVLYLRGPGMSSIATRRNEGLDSAKPANVDVKSLKVQGSTVENAFTAVSSWLTLSTVRPEATQIIFSQNADFIFGARKAFESNTNEPDRSKWLALPCAGVGVPKQVKTLVDQGILCAAVLTSLTTDKALEMLVQGLKSGTQPPEQTYVEATSYPSLEELAEKRTKR